MWKTCTTYKNGFTLIELVVVIVVASIIGGVVIRPAVSRFLSKSATYTVAKEWQYLIQSAQVSALSNANFSRVQINSNSIQLFNEDQTNNTWTLTKTVSIQQDALSATTSLPHNQLIFSKQGEPFVDAGNDTPAQVNTALSSTQTIQLQDQSESTTIMVYPTTGFSEINQ